MDFQFRAIEGYANWGMWKIILFENKKQLLNR